MSGGWQNSDRGSRLPPNWESEIRPFVLKRCGGRCEALLASGARCPRPATDVDHKNRGDDHRYVNLQGLCAHHHGRKSSQEGNQARRGAPKARPPESHPGWRG